MATAIGPAPKPSGAAPPRLALRPDSWAFKYGGLAEGRFGYDKSGFSPTEYVLPSIGTTENAITVEIEKFQRANIYGFTSRELGELDCLPTRELEPGNLQNGIIPILRRERWERFPAQPDLTRDHLYPLQNGNGMWSGDNPEVWAILEPVVKLASRMLMSIHVMPWFDALLNGQRKPVPDSRLHPENQGEIGLDYITLRAFTPDEQGYLARQRDQAFEELRTIYRYQFGFMISSESPAGPEQDAAEALALTFENHCYMLNNPSTNKSWRSFTFINISQLELLMRDGLNTAERMMIEWSIANTVKPIVHEVMHAVASIFTSLRNLYHLAEPYFEDECLSEVGYTFESLMNSGIPEAILSDPDDPSPPLGHLLQRMWPSYTDVFSRNPETPILKDPGPYTYNEYFPIPISFYEDIQQENFWSVVRQYGNCVFHYRALKEGARVQYTVMDIVDGKFKSKNTGRFTEQSPIKILNGQFRSDVLGLMAAINLSPEEREALRFGVDLINSSDAQEKFWSLGVEQRRAIQRVKDAMAYASQNGAHPQLNLIIFSFTTQAITHHGKMIINLKAQELANGTIYTDRRANFLAWNQGVRSFIRELVRKDPQGYTSAGVEELRLEQCWMYLWSLHDPNTRSGKDWLEFQILQNARQGIANGDKELCRSYCSRLIGEDWRSLFAECSARFILFILDKDVTAGLSDRVVELKNVASVLAKVLANAPPFWKDEVEALQTDVQLILLRMPMQGL
ncbi:hypothetical protein N431DRAFT_345678 [Stipitochalara longipes BDJ]|nr:hypothetical protein N431DRAFT_345678 [Stipitochalara longipes BDJ]